MAANATSPKCTCRRYRTTEDGRPIVLRDICAWHLALCDSKGNRIVFAEKKDDDATGYAGAFHSKMTAPRKGKKR